MTTLFACFGIYIILGIITLLIVDSDRLDLEDSDTLGYILSWPYLVWCILRSFLGSSK